MEAFKLLAVIGLSVMLAGCPKGSAGITCPTLKQYSMEFQSKVSDEWNMIESKAPNIIIMLNDYGVERDAIRKCLALQKKARK